MPVEYLLRPLSPFHFTVGREDDPADIEDLPRSDTLTSAILAAWRHVDPQAQIQAIATAPPFALSSAMPAIEHAGGLERLMFIPPGLAERALLDSPDRRKRFRKARFAAPSALRAMLQNARIPDDALVVSDRGELINPDPAPRFHPAHTNHTWRRLWLRQSRPRLSIDRLSGKATEGILFRYGAITFRRDLRLIVLAEFVDPGWRPRFEAALRLLGEEGIGGGRSIGHGRFQITAINEAPVMGLGSDARMLLSLMLPSRTEVDNGLLDPPAVYALVARGGWAEADGAGRARRKVINMLTEGSVINDLRSARYGQSVCVLPAGPLPYSVYRSGCAITIPISWSEV